MSESDGRHDFDFWTGEGRTRNRRLGKRLAGSDEWAEFESTGTAWETNWIADHERVTA